MGEVRETFSAVRSSSSAEVEETNESSVFEVPESSEVVGSLDSSSVGLSWLLSDSDGEYNSPEPEVSLLSSVSESSDEELAGLPLGFEELSDEFSDEFSS